MQVASDLRAADLAQSVNVFALYAGCSVFESQPRHTLVVKTGSDNSTSIPLGTGTNVRILGDDLEKGFLESHKTNTLRKT